MTAAGTANAGRAAACALPEALNVALTLVLSLLGGLPARIATADTEHPAAASEPRDYWTGPIDSPVPATIAGGRVIHAPQLRRLLKDGGAVIVDVSNAPRRPDGLAAAAPWLPLPHQAIPGSIWIPGAGRGEVSSAAESFFRRRLAAATGNDISRPLIVYCHRQCWLSWNAAKRAIRYGYRNVYWFADGVEGWRAAGLRTATVAPEPSP